MNILPYFFVLLASFLVDCIPFVGPPAWMVMVFFQVHYELNVWMVLVIGVTGSALGRLFYSWYIPRLSDRFITKQKNEDIQFIGARLAKSSWKVQLFVFIYTLVPLPSTPLFTAAGMARIKPLHIIPAFFAGKFISDAVMLHAGKFVANNFQDVMHGLLSWRSLIGTLIVIAIICVFLFIDWKKLLTQKKLTLSFKIFK